MTSKEYRDKYKQQLADQFKSLLQRDGTNWINGIQQAKLTAPLNAVTGRKYNGINSFSLLVASYLCGYDDPRWVTMPQIKDKNNSLHPHEKWHLKAGSHGQTIQYWLPYDTVSQKFITWNEMEAKLKCSRKKEDFKTLAKYYYVFNASQIDGIKPYTSGIVLHNDIKADNLIDKLSKKMDVNIVYDTHNEAYYSPSQDCIHLPNDPRIFISSAEYNGVILHELCHAAGGNSRLNRDQSGKFGDEKYAFEELVAEMGSCFMAIDLTDIDISAFNHFENNEAYLRSWIKATDDPDALIRAIKEAQKTSDYMEMKAGISSQKEYEKKYITSKNSAEKQRKNFIELTPSSVQRIGESTPDFVEDYTISSTKSSQKCIKIHH